MIISVCCRRWTLSKTLVLGALVGAGMPAAWAVDPAEPAAAPATSAAVTPEAVAVPAAEVKAVAPEAPAPPVAAEAPAVPVVLRLGTIAANVLNIRARPGENYEVIGKFQRGEEVKVISEKGDWLEVLVPERVEAWVASLYVDAEGKVVADRIRVHAGPGVVFSTYAFVTRGTMLKKIGQPSADGWQKIAAPASATAWISKKYVEPKAAAPVATPEITPVPVTAPAAAPAVTPATTPAPVAAPATVPAAGPTPAAVVDLDAKPAATSTAPASAAVNPVAAVAVAVAAQSADTALVAAVKKDEPAQTEAVTAAATAEASESQVPVLPAPGAVATPSTVAPAASATSAATERAVTRVGVISSLKEQSSAVCTHLLAVQVGQKLFSDSYLVSSRIALNEWEGQWVRITAREVWYAGWKRPVLEVTGIERIEP